MAMLIPDYNNGFCYKSINYDGDCCCNCKHRVLLVIYRFPLGYYCNHPIYEKVLTFIGYSGHSICEMYERANNLNKNK